MSSLRKRVQEIADTDPEFYALMLDWKDQFKSNHKNNWLDRRIEYKLRDTLSRKLVKKTFTIEDALNLMWEVYNDDPDWGYEWGALVS